MKIVYKHTIFTYARRSDGAVVIPDVFRGAYEGFINALVAHERVHLKEKKGFLPDSSVYLQKHIKLLTYFVQKYRFEELEGKLKKPIDENSPDFFLAKKEVAKKISDFHRSCANLIAFSETEDEETRNWLLSLDCTEDERAEFVFKKTKDALQILADYAFR